MSRPRVFCTSCDANVAEAGEAYMLHDEVWNAAATHDEVLCVGCLEERLGRTLTPADFIRHAPINATRFEELPATARPLADVLLHKSERLRARLEGRPARE